MVKYDRLGIESAIERFLSIKQKDNAKNIRKAVRRKKRKDLKIGEKIAAIFDLHFRKSYAIDLSELIKAYKEFNTSTELYMFPDDLKQDVEFVGAHTTSSVFSELSTSINSALMRSHDAARTNLVFKNNKLLKALKKSKLESKYITYWEKGKAINASLEAGVIHLGNKKLAALNSVERFGMVKFNADAMEAEEPPLSEVETCLTDIEDMVRKGEMPESDITKNVGEIRIIFRKRAVLEELNTRIWKIMCTLKAQKKNSGIDFSEANKILQTVYDRNRRELSRCDTYLAKFDFVSLQEKVTWVRDKREQEAWVRQSLEALDRVNQITPRNPEVIRQIKRSNLITMEAKKDLRHLAIHELQATGSITNNHQHIAGIAVYSPVTDEEQEVLIREKIDEMISIASQTPEQRAVSYLNSMGTGNLEVSDLGETQLEEYRSVFGDGAYSFDVGRIRKIKEIIDSQRVAKATAICREYIKYRAACKDSASVTFSEYARTLYRQENMDLSMVDEKVRNVDIALVAQNSPARTR